VRSRTTGSQRSGESGQIAIYRQEVKVDAPVSGRNGPARQIKLYSTNQAMRNRIFEKVPANSWLIASIGLARFRFSDRSLIQVGLMLVA
jgi:hypothetical protein